MMQILPVNSRNFFLGILFILGSCISFAQQKGAVKFFVDNENGYFEVLVDDTLLIKRYKDSLTVGEHHAQIWSYGYDVSDVSFTVKADTVTEVHVKLDRSMAFGAYEESYSRYRIKFHKSVTVPVSLTLAFSITSGTFMLNAYDLKKKVVTDMENYSLTTVPDEIATIKNRVEVNNKKYNFSRTGYYISGGFALAGIATSIYTCIKFKKSNTEPTYSKQSPFADKVSFQFTGNGFALQLKLG